MAQVKTAELGSSISSWRAFFANLGCSLISVSEVDNNNGFDILVDTDKSDIRIYSPDNGATMMMSGTIRGTSFGSQVRIGFPNNNGDLSVFVVYTDKIFYFQIIDKVGRCQIYFYEQIDNKKIIGGIINTGNGIYFRDISSLELMDDNNNPYKHDKRLNYTAQAGYIDYSYPDKLFLNSILTDISDESFLNCSTVTPNQVITIGGKNYFTIGTNTLVELDDD